MLMMALPGKRKRGRPKRRFMDVVKEDMAEVEVTGDRNNWRRKIHLATPDGKKPKEEEVLGPCCGINDAAQWTDDLR